MCNIASSRVWRPGLCSPGRYTWPSQLLLAPRTVQRRWKEKKKKQQLNLCRVSKSLSSVPPSSSSLRDSHFIKSTCHSAQGRGNWHTHKAAQPPPLLRVKTPSLSRSLTPVCLREATLQPYGPQPARLLCPWDSPSENTGAGCHCLLRVIFPTQGWKPCILCLCVGSWVLCR